MAKFYVKPCFPCLGGTISDTVVEVKNTTLTHSEIKERFNITEKDMK